MVKEPVQPQDKYVLRLPDGMRERIKSSAEKNNRSMNAEIVAALEQFFPPEATIEEVLERVHEAIDLANKPNSLPYRQVLVDALDALSSRLSSGIEFDQFRSSTPSNDALDTREFIDRFRRWKRVEKYGVEQSDLERELARGLLHKFGRSSIFSALIQFRNRKPERALKILRLDTVKFANPEAAQKAIEADIRAFYRNNWGDPDSPDEASDIYDSDDG